MTYASTVRGLKLHYESDAKYFNSTTGRITDKSAQRNHGTVANALSLDTDWMGHANRAISFNGANDSISISHDNSLNLVDGFSASIRVRPTDVLGSPQGIFTKGNYALKEYDDEYIFQVIGPSAGWGNQLTPGVGPYGLCVYNGKLYCACYNSNNVYTYDGSTWTDSGSVGTGPRGLCVYNGKLYCACYGTNNVYVYDGSTWTNSGSVGTGPTGLCVYDGELYCTCYSANRVYVYDGSTWANSGTVETGPLGLCTYDSNLYCSCYGSSDVYMYNGSTWTDTGAPGGGHRGLCVYNGKIYCACYSSNRVYAYDGSTWTDSGAVGTDPVSLCVYGGKMYCACYTSNNVYVYDGSSWTNSGSVGTRPMGQGVYGGKLYCSCSTSHNVYEFGTGEAVRVDRAAGWDLVHVDYTATSMSITLNNDMTSKVTTSHSLALNNNALALKIGASYGSSQSGYTGGSSEYLDGLFGEIRMYNRTLSTEEQAMIAHTYRPKLLIG